ncbi:4-hydroxy-3-methylbut-2-enyl diphosphate reductase [hydrothermal vent metagenome]|uniref:4-hydroxy-3-methylbut-2-enyl diphosphate reductase n=1 Tax=hydrothermal vent metagenome TaxID=652676 RepID=A0A3B1CU07_9ZZZZ
MKKFNIPDKYRSSIIAEIKKQRKLDDPMKKDFNPTEIDLGPVRFLIARHFGFCYGVENAIEIAYKAIEENVGKRIFLLSEMIHNPAVNDDLQAKGVKFLQDTSGKMIIDWNKLTPEDIVIIPAFGTTIEIEQKLNKIGINPYRYNTTCPFVEKVWNKSNELGEKGFTVVIHGKAEHEETRATFSHRKKSSPSIIIRDMSEATKLAEFMMGEINFEEFYEIFRNRVSQNFNAENDLQKIGVVNQTTMLASETEAIANYLKGTMIVKYGLENIDDHFADTRDTLCYATNDNQKATYGLMEEYADLAVVVGGYNSSNTSHIVKLLEERFPTYFISDETKIISSEVISHFDLHEQSEKTTKDYLPVKDKISIAVTSGASCPDATVDRVIKRLASFYGVKI